MLPDATPCNPQIDSAWSTQACVTVPEITRTRPARTFSKNNGFGRTAQ